MKRQEIFEDSTRKEENSNMNIQIKPMRMYSRNNNLKYDDLKEGDIVVAQITSFIWDTISLRVSSTITATMYIEDYKGDKEKDFIVEKVVNSHVGKNVLARVKVKKNNRIILERKSVADETIEYFSKNLNIVVSAIIESIVPYGAFVDIGNGVTSLIPIKELTASHIEFGNIQSFFKCGNHIKVRILDYNPETCLFMLSRKKVYPPFTEKKIPAGSCMLVTCFGFVNEKREGVFVEIDPDHVGILDIPESYNPNEFKAGRKIVVKIRSWKDSRRFKALFIRFANE